MRNICYGDILICHIGNIKYYYDNKANNYEYTAHLLIVSKIVNYNCIYNINNVSIKEKEELKEYETKYDNNVNNLNQNIFEKNNNHFTYTNVGSDRLPEPQYHSGGRGNCPDTGNRNTGNHYFQSWNVWRGYDLG